MRRLFPLLVLFLFSGSLLILSGCMVVPNRDSRVKYLILEQESTLLKAVLGPKINICFTANSIKDQKYRGWAKASLLEWVDALRPISPKPLTTTVEIVEESAQHKCPRDTIESVDEHGTPTLVIQLLKGDGTAMGGAMSIDINTDGVEENDHQALLHEMGHCFGLADLYGEETCPGHMDSNGNEIPDQITDADDPYANKCTTEAIMNGSQRPIPQHLHADDIAGVRYLFKKLLKQMGLSAESTAGTRSP